MISMPVSLCHPEYSFRIVTVAKYHTPDLGERKQVSVQFPEEL